MRRGDIFIAAARGAYSGKPRPVALIQDDRFDATASITVVPFTTSDVDAPLLRIEVHASDVNGLAENSRLMVDKVTTVPRANLTQQIGRLTDQDLFALDRALLVFLGLAG
ncbi:type II toxin-antitoxin system PemK/MazF family toxin [Mycolicibacterium hippocampi]|uniref:Putative endoribonuclease MazF n=1 Tax=Mycolicibacterium hippocampi TaxID=659824 RepID=A0A7I9ZM46_9MYCO|nr:type II toxin-antitoxin system PemK/MazF family toxin [Mycolicibacterium hippocampi]GFH01899.1 putative endoribonuclease MazF [Mycolicibacterium hippocampi]